jgi:folate-binding protein YgfZ
MTQLALLPDRGVIALSGADRVAFLNGLVSNDVTRAAPGTAVWAALLTPQGRYLCDFFIFTEAERLLLDAPRALLEGVLAKLRRMKLRADVALADVSAEVAVYAGWGGETPALPLCAPDPRLAHAGFRVLSAVELPTNATARAYAAHRIALGLPDGPPDLEVEKTLLLEAGFDELGGVSWDKGCYMGQELTARTKYRGLVKKRLVPVGFAGAAPPPGTVVMAAGAEVGVVHSAAGQVALATLRLEALDKPLSADDIVLTPQLPSWIRLA